MLIEWLALMCRLLTYVMFISVFYSCMFLFNCRKKQQSQQQPTSQSRIIPSILKYPNIMPISNQIGLDKNDQYAAE